jgi:ribose 5-phosphate isomerase A
MIRSLIRLDIEVAADDEKRLAAEAAAELIGDGMLVGLGTGSTVAHLLPALAARGLEGVRCVATSVATEEQGRELGLAIEPFDSIERLDIAIDGADQISPDGWLVKGGGGAHTREKIVAAAADRFIVIADSSKPVDELEAPVPLELHRFGLAATLAELRDALIREGADPSPDGGVIADWFGEVKDPIVLAGRLSATPGVVDHGLFPPGLVADLIVARGDGVEHRSL